MSEEDSGQWISAATAAERADMQLRRMQRLCRAGRVVSADGRRKAKLVGAFDDPEERKQWHVPADFVIVKHDLSRRRNKAGAVDG